MLQKEIDLLKRDLEKQKKLREDAEIKYRVGFTECLSPCVL